MREKNPEWEKIVFECKETVKMRYPQLVATIEFGAYIWPDNYFVSFIFATNKELEEAKNNGVTNCINEYFKECMKNKGYPNEAIKDCVFAAQEDCDKKYNGNWYYYYK